MAFKLDKQEIARRDELFGDLTDARAKLEDAVSVYNAEVLKLREALDAKLAAYNEVVEEASGFAADIASAADGAIGDKSEKWQEGDRGQAATAWKDEWENASFDAVEIEYPDDLSIDQVDDHASTLSELSEEASE